jgi:hypothetical protein
VGINGGEDHFDCLNRVTQRTYPDDTTEMLTYVRLDLVEQKDRLSRITPHFFDGFGRRTAARDPADRTISQVWCDCGAMEALVDANSNQTRGGNATCSPSSRTRIRTRALVKRLSEQANRRIGGLTVQFKGRRWRR